MNKTKNFAFAVILLLLISCTEIDKKSLEKAFNSAVKSADIYEAVLYAENTNGDFSEIFCYGDRDIDTPMLTASVGKMFITACILKLCDESLLSLNDKISRFFDENQLKGLHVFNGKDYSFDLTVADLLFQTSGLVNSSRTLADEDAYFPFEERLAAAKALTPLFIPASVDHSTKIAYYANINFTLLGKILEFVTGMPLADVCRQIVFDPLGMDSTYLPVSIDDFIPYMYYKDQKIFRPNNILTSGAAGGFVSTPRDLMAFSKGFWEGRLFDKSVLEKLADYRKLKPYPGPAYYGGGYMRISLYLGKGELIGHSGVTGSFALYYPDKDLHFVGDFNQLEKPSAPFLMLIKLAMTAQ